MGFWANLISFNFLVRRRADPNSWDVVRSFRMHLEYPGMYEYVIAHISMFLHRQSDPDLQFYQ